MKLASFILLLFISIACTANNPYRAYLLSTIPKQVCTSNKKLGILNPAKVSFEVPRFERPIGAVFCRMEDYLTTKTKVWIKIGVK